MKTPFRPPTHCQGLTHLDEDQRISLIVAYLQANPGRTLGVMVDSDPPDKADRYVAKLQGQIPGLDITRQDGPRPTITTTLKLVVKQ